MPKKLTQEEFVSRSHKIHKNKYDYSLVVYINKRTKIKIVCPIHGSFLQLPDAHLAGKGCKECGFKNRINPNIIEKSLFLRRAKKVHGDKYDYSFVEYKNSSTKVIIICPIHGEFQQTPHAHTKKKQGCFKCCSQRTYLTLEAFIDKSNKMHNNKYDYSKVEYNGNRFKVCIICPDHGEFWQNAARHLKGGGCFRCNESHGERKIKNFLTIKNIIFEEQKTFEDCKFINSLLFDFYIQEFNLCIEYDGQQHFQSIDFFGGESRFLLQKKRDQIKTKYCKDNNIRLLRIPYFKFKNIEKIIANYLGDI